jgi:hypothetical protein
VCGIGEGQGRCSPHLVRRHRPSREQSAPPPPSHDRLDPPYNLGHTAAGDPTNPLLPWRRSGSPLGPLARCGAETPTIQSARCLFLARRCRQLCRCFSNFDVGRSRRQVVQRLRTLEARPFSWLVPLVALVDFGVGTSSWSTAGEELGSSSQLLPRGRRLRLVEYRRVLSRRERPLSAWSATRARPPSRRQPVREPGA